MIPLEPKDKLTMRLNYNCSAPTYDKVYSAEQEAKYHALFTQRDLGRYQSILDLGCGTALFPLFARARGMKGLITCVDFSIQMLKIAKARVAKDTDVHLVCAEINHLPFRQAKFDLVVAFTVLQLARDPGVCLEDLKTVVNEDALLVTTWLRKNYDVDQVKVQLRRVGISQVELLDNRSHDLITTSVLEFKSKSLGKKSTR